MIVGCLSFSASFVAAAGMHFAGRPQAVLFSSTLRDSCQNIGWFAMLFKLWPPIQEPTESRGFSMKFIVAIDRDEDGVWVVECPSIPGCVSQGMTKAEALENIKDAIRGCLDVRAERGMPLTVETCQVEVLA